MNLFFTQQPIYYTLYFTHIFSTFFTSVLPRPKRCKYICNTVVEYIEKVGVDNVVQIYMDNGANMFDVPRF